MPNATSISRIPNITPTTASAAFRECRRAQRLSSRLSRPDAVAAPTPKEAERWSTRARVNRAEARSPTSPVAAIPAVNLQPRGAAEIVVCSCATSRAGTRRSPRRCRWWRVPPVTRELSSASGLESSPPARRRPLLPPISRPPRGRVRLRAAAAQPAPTPVLHDSAPSAPLNCTESQIAASRGMLRRPMGSISEAAGALGRRTAKMVPFSLDEATSMLPPWAWTM